MADCLKFICETMRWSIGHVYFFNKKIVQLISSRIWYLEDPEKMKAFKTASEEMIFSKGVGLPGRVWDMKKPACIVDVAQDNNFPRAKYCEKINIHSAVAFPVLLNKKVIAVFEFFSDEVQERDEKLLNAFEVMGEQMGRVFERNLAHEELEKYVEALQKTNATLESFAYAASHDLKAPLRVIDNASKWLEEDLEPHLTPSTRENMTLLRGRVKRMEKLLDDLLEYARIGHTQDARFSEIIPGDVLIKNILEMLVPPIDVIVTVDPYFSKIMVNRMPLQQIFMNLISNAIKHREKPDVHVNVSVTENTDHYLFSVKDDGPGIAPEFHEKIFQLFQTLKPRDQVEGSGMGLALVRKNIETFGGTLRLESAVGQGSTFYFTWPKK